MAKTTVLVHKDFVLKGYTSIRKDRESGRGGVVETFIQHTLRYKVIQIGIDHESIVGKIWTDKC